MKNKKILLGLTTTIGSDWKKKIREINEFKIEEVALFLTGIDKEKRQELYSLLEKSCLKSAPHVHLRDDMGADEIRYLREKYNTQLFNIHPIGQAKFRYNYNELKDYMDMIYIENTVLLPTQKELDECGGLCVDFSHWENRKNRKEYQGLGELARKNKIGCCHVSGIWSLWGFFPRDMHFAKAKSNFNYLKKYESYLPDFISLELENDFKEQLEFKRYIENMLELG